jgi:hypothetical protein
VPELVGGLDALGVSLGSDPRIERALHLMLPSFDDGPQHSPQLLLAGEDRGPDSPDLLHPWVVPAIDLTPATALELLLGCWRCCSPSASRRRAAPAAPPRVASAVDRRC